MSRAPPRPFTSLRMPIANAGHAAGGELGHPHQSLTAPAGARFNTRGEREVMRFAALAGTFAAVAFAVAAPSPAVAARGLAMPLEVSGSVVATWHGDPARGCAAAGVCATSGSATYRPGFDGRLEVSRNSIGFGGAEYATPPVVRVRSGRPDDPVACA